MLIKFLEIQNFRKLKSIRVDFSEDKTVFVGANNSGKTSAMVALSSFLIDKDCFTVNDITASNWKKIKAIGEQLENTKDLAKFLQENIDEWNSLFPSLDVWLDIPVDQIHYVIHLLPSLSWMGGLLGIRLRLEVKEFGSFCKDFIIARKLAKETLEAAKKKHAGENVLGEIIYEYSVDLWPADMLDFLETKIKKLFTIRSYNLDISKLVCPQNGIAQPQKLTATNLAIEEDPFKKLIRIDKIDAHRGFSNLIPLSSRNEDGEERYSSNKGKLSDQLRAYYKKHIDPSTNPEPDDVDALDAIHKAQKQFDEKLKTGFKTKFEELEMLGYPGITDPKLEISTKIRPVDGLNHSSALKYQVATDEEANRVCLPEYYSGLGYQNLISMVFRLMSFRDDWMQVGKMGKLSRVQLTDAIQFEPLHLVLVEEPEAHLHVQVQQVFIKKAYDILRNHIDLKGKKNLSTQLVISTHSSHIAHETEFSRLRYFRRRPIIKSGEVPITTVVNLREVFGNDKDTERFVKRYLQSTHCDLFFADGAILVEGATEGILVPYFIREKFSALNESYITVLEIGGSHAHRLRPLIQELGIITLIITDLDAGKGDGKHQSVQPLRANNQVSRNTTLKTWLPKKDKIDELIDALSKNKIIEEEDNFAIRVAYQTPIMLKLEGDTKTQEVIPNTFEDAFALENIEFIKQLDGAGLAASFKDDISNSNTVDELGPKIYESIQKGKKAEFALDILYAKDLTKIVIPTYIEEGLSWMSDKLVKRQKENLIAELKVVGEKA